MAQHFCFMQILICFFVTKSNSSIYQPSYLEFISDSVGVKTFRSNTMTNKRNNFSWNGGTILTHESNQKSLKGRSETTIVSTRCGNLMFIGFNSIQGFCYDNNENHPDCAGVPDGFDNGLSHYSVSFDGGKTWKYMYAPPHLGTDIYTRTDPWMSMGGKMSKNSEEYLYFANLAINKSEGVTGINNFIGLSVHVARMIYQNNDPQQKAINFEWIRSSLIPNINVDDFMDKESIAADPYHANKAYVSYTQFGGNRFNEIEFYATNDAGISWIGPVVLQDKGSGDIRSQFSNSVVAANGDVYIIWYSVSINDFGRSINYKFIKSIDGGITFPDPAISINPKFFKLFNPVFHPPIATNRAYKQSQATIDVFTTLHSDGYNYLNRIIVAYEYSLNGSFDGGQITGFIDDDSFVLNSVNIGVSYSDDTGKRWKFIDPFKEPIPKRFVKRIFPTVSVSSDGKSVNIAYLEIHEVKKSELPICNPIGLNVRTSYYHSMADTYYIHSDNGGITWSDPIRLNDESVDWCTTRTNIAPNYGDYMLSISDSTGNVHLAGVTNGFTSVPGFEPPLTTVDVIYYYNCNSKRKKKCNKDRKRKRIYKTFNNAQYKEVYISKLADLENINNGNIEINISWIVILIGMCGIATCVAGPYFIWMYIKMI